MAMIDTAARAPHGAFAAQSITAPFVNFVAWVRQGLAATATADELSRLTPKMREDIGITESDIVAFRQSSFLL